MGASIPRQSGSSSERSRERGECVETRALGRTGLDVGVVGLGTDYLNGKTREQVTSVIREAVSRGVDYIDLPSPFPEYRDNLGAALRGCREQVILAGHLGSTLQKGQYCKTRRVSKSEVFFDDLLLRLGTDHIDVLFLHNCDSPKDYGEIVRPGGQLDLALKYRQQGKARFIGFSGHTASTALQAVESGQVDVLMFPVNIGGNAVPGKRELLSTCVAGGVGVVAMKPFAGGKLLREEPTVRVAQHQAGGMAVKLRKRAAVTVAQCLSYVLSQAGVATCVPGCADVEQVSAAANYAEATNQERDFAALLAGFEQYVAGECVYCNHCLPCPAAIDIGGLFRLSDAAQRHLTAQARSAYASLPATAVDCTGCGACTERCPFGVDVVAKMQEAASLFA